MLDTRQAYIYYHYKLTFSWYFEPQYRRSQILCCLNNRQFFVLQGRQITKYEIDIMDIQFPLIILLHKTSKVVVKWGNLDRLV